MKIGIIGAGALGSLLGFALSGAAGCEVWLLSGWPEQVAAIAAHGLTCERDGVATTRPVQAASAPEAIGPCDLVLVAVKSYQTERAAARAPALLHPTTLVVTLQNGIGNRETLARALGAGRVAQGVTLLGATLLAPGRVRHAGMGATYVAAPDVPALRRRCAELVACLNSVGLPAELRDDVEALVWSKLVVNVGINALTALLRMPNGALAALPPARDLVARLVGETVAVAAARGTPLPSDTTARVLAVAEATAANRSSMLQDVLRGSPTEIHAINGAVVREGARLGVATPYNQVITELVTALEAALLSQALPPSDR